MSKDGFLQWENGVSRSKLISQVNVVNCYLKLMWQDLLKVTQNGFGKPIMMTQILNQLLS